jgi:hypothetical protein
MAHDSHDPSAQPVIQDSNSGYNSYLELLTEEELVHFLRIPSISDAKNPHNVIEHLKRYRDLPRLHICNKVLYPVQAIREWITRQTVTGRE